MSKNVNEMDGDDDNKEDRLGLPIQDIDGSVHIKNIPPSFLPKFNGLRIEDPETFLFEFKIISKSYGYLSKTQNLRLFPTTLKDRALRWFMSLGTNSIR